MLFLFNNRILMMATMTELVSIHLGTCLNVVIQLGLPGD